MRKCIYIVLFFVTWLVFPSAAQKPRHDGGLWMGFRINKQLPRSFSVGMEYQYRLDRNFGRLRWHYLYGNVGYRINSYLAANIVYRFGTSPRGFNHSFLGSLTARYKTKDWQVTCRTSYQRKQPYFNNEFEPGMEPQNIWRNRFGFQHDLPEKLEIFTSAELFTAFPQGAPVLTRLRTALGLNWEFYNYNVLSVGYIFQPQFNTNSPAWSHILSVNYQFDIPKKMKWKKFFHPEKGRKDKRDRENPSVD